MKALGFGLIGAGLMGREFASATARWCHLLQTAARPELVAVASRSAPAFDWFRTHFPALRQYTHDYRELLANPAVEAVYVAVPHHLHREMCCAALDAGKHLMAEKPVGIDLAAFEAVRACAARHPELLARCASQWMFYPGAQRIGDLLERGAFGRILEVNAGFLHSSDLDPHKPINWKRMIEFNGEYGVLGDLGMHVCALPFRAGWKPQNVRAILSDIVSERPDGQGGRVPCRTWDNATLLCETPDPTSGARFPMTLKMQRIAPGQRNTWYLEVLGTRTSARYSTRDPKRLDLLEYAGGPQVWSHLETGHDTAYPTITGANFEFGFPDAILQMWAAFMREYECECGHPRDRERTSAHGRALKPYAGCVTLEEVGSSHRLFTAALASQRNQSVEPVPNPEPV